MTAPRVQQRPFDEREFRRWYRDHATKAGIDPDPDNPLHKYDYRAAYRAGYEPERGEDGLMHWPSEFKSDDHPNRFVGGIDTKYGKPMQGERPDFSDVESGSASVALTPRWRGEQENSDKNSDKNNGARTKRISRDDYQRLRALGWTDEDLRADGLEWEGPNMQRLRQQFDRGKPGKIQQVAATILNGLSLGGASRLDEQLRERAERGASPEVREMLAATRPSASMREAREEFREESPLTATALEVAGGAMLPISGALNTIRNTGTLGKVIASAPAQGAIAGGAYGANEAAEGDALAGAVRGAATGAIAGGVLSGLAKGIDRVRAPNRSPALKALERSMERRKLTPDAVAANLSDPYAQRAGHMLADELPELTEAVATLPGKGAREIAEALETRAAGRTGRELEAARGALGVSATPTQLSKVLKAQKVLDSEPLYTMLRALPDVADDRLTQLVNASPRLRRMFDKAGEEVSERAAIEALKSGTAAPSKATTEGFYSFATLERFKRKIDDGIRTALKQGQNNAAEQLQLVQRELVGVMDELSTDPNTGESLYRAARGAFAGPARQATAVKGGRDLLAQADDDVREFVQSLTAQQREGKNVGLLDALRRKPRFARSLVGSSPDASYRQGVLREAVGDDDAFDAILSTLKAEAKGEATKAQALQGSRTQMRAAAQQDLDDNLLANAADVATGGLSNMALLRLFMQRGRRTAGWREGTRDAVADALRTRPGDTNFERLMRQMELRKKAHARAQKLGRAGGAAAHPHTKERSY